MTDFNRPHIVPSITDLQSSKEFQALLHERNLTKLYGKFIIPLYKELSSLHSDMKISTAQYNMRMASIMRIIQLAEDFIFEKQHGIKTTLFFIKDIQMPSFHLKVIEGLLYAEHINSLFIKNANPSLVDAQLIQQHKADRLFFINKTSIDNVVAFPYLHGVKVQYLSYYKLEQLINSLPSYTGESFQLYNWLCATHDRDRENH